MSKQIVYVVLNNIRSRENVGSIFRTADASGIEKIYLCGITPTPPHEKISKTALGADTYVPWEYHKNCWQLLKNLQQKNIKIIALEQSKNAKNIFSYTPRYPIALIIGNEVTGISKNILKYAQDTIQIPMRGKKESLNVAVAFGIASFLLRN